MNPYEYRHYLSQNNSKVKMKILLLILSSKFFAQVNAQHTDGLTAKRTLKAPIFYLKTFTIY